MEPANEVSADGGANWMPSWEGKRQRTNSRGKLSAIGNRASRYSQTKASVLFRKQTSGAEIGSVFGTVDVVPPLVSVRCAISSALARGLWVTPRPAGLRSADSHLIDQIGLNPHQNGQRRS